MAGVCDKVKTETEKEKEANNMAKYEITYSCGHVGTERLFGKTSRRYRYIDWCHRHAICADCAEQLRQENDAAAAAANAEAGLPPLTGTEKQIAWAEAIRYKMTAEPMRLLNALDRARVEAPHAAARELVELFPDFVAWLTSQSSARWWIDSRPHKVAWDPNSGNSRLGRIWWSTDASWSGIWRWRVKKDHDQVYKDYEAARQRAAARQARRTVGLEAAIRRMAARAAADLKLEQVETDRHGNLLAVRVARREFFVSAIDCAIVDGRYHCNGYDEPRRLWQAARQLVNKHEQSRLKDAHVLKVQRTRARSKDNTFVALSTGQQLTGKTRLSDQSWRLANKHVSCDHPQVLRLAEEARLWWKTHRRGRER